MDFEPLSGIILDINILTIFIIIIITYIYLIY